MNDDLKAIKRRIDTYVKGNLSEDQINELWIDFAKQPELLNDLEIEIGVLEILKNKSDKSSKEMTPFKLSPFWMEYASVAVVILVFGIQLFYTPKRSKFEQFIIHTIKSD